MTEELQGYALLCAALLAVATVGCLLAVLVMRAARAALPAVWGAQDEPATGVRRCESCGKGWRSTEGKNHPLPRLVVAKTVRRVCGRWDREPPEWALPQGWHRCPSCFSARVRTSGERLLPRPVTRLAMVLAAAAAVAGAVLLGMATLGALANVAAA